MPKYDWRPPDSMTGTATDGCQTYDLTMHAKGSIDMRAILQMVQTMARDKIWLEQPKHSTSEWDEPTRMRIERNHVAVIRIHTVGVARETARMYEEYGLDARPTFQGRAEGKLRKDQAYSLTDSVGKPLEPGCTFVRELNFKAEEQRRLESQGCVGPQDWLEVPPSWWSHLAPYYAYGEFRPHGQGDFGHCTMLSV